MSQIGITQIPLGQSRALRLPDQAVKGAEEGASFGDKIKGMLDGVDTQLKTADTKVAAYIAGEDIPIHNVMLELSKAELSMRLTSAVATKAIEAYQEITRMQL